MPASPLPPSSAPRLLVSVRDPAEAEVARLAGADLIDAKDPARGALGALDPDVVAEIVVRVGAFATTSAVADERVPPALIAATGVDWVKLGIGPRRSRPSPPPRRGGSLPCCSPRTARAPTTSRRWPRRGSPGR